MGIVLGFDHYDPWVCHIRDFGLWTASDPVILLRNPQAEFHWVSNQSPQKRPCPNEHHPQKNMFFPNFVRFHLSKTMKTMFFLVSRCSGGKHVLLHVTSPPCSRPNPLPKFGPQLPWRIPVLWGKTCDLKAYLTPQSTHEKLVNAMNNIMRQWDTIKVIAKLHYLTTVDGQIAVWEV